MAWIYFIAYHYPKGLDVSRWAHDNRMSQVRCDAAMTEGIKKGYIKKEGDTWYPTEKAKNIAREFFNRDDDSEREKFVDELRKYSDEKDWRNSYPIWRLPLEIYEEERKEKRKAGNKITLTDSQYVSLKKFLESYQRYPESTSTAGIRKLAGRVNELCEDKDYVLYRGINFYDKNSKQTPTYNVGDKVPSNHLTQSWTTNEKIALQFAYGNPTPMEVTLKKHRFDDGIGYIMKHTFKPESIILDFVYVDEANEELNDGSIFWPVECEVLVSVKPRSAFEVYKVV